MVSNPDSNVPGPHMDKSFGQIVREARAKKGLSQKELAARAGVHHSYISKIESGRELPSQEKVGELANALGVEKLSFELAAGYLPSQLVKVVAGREELRRLLLLAARGKLSEKAYEKIRELVSQEDRVNVPVWLE